MPPTSKKGANPAPDFTLHMNRIQSALEGNLKAAARALLPAHARASNPNPSSSSTSKPHGKFSSLAATSPSLPLSKTSPRATTDADEFAEDYSYGMDPNAGLGMVRPSKQPDVPESGAGAGERGLVRGRGGGYVLGKRRPGREPGHWRREEHSSSDSEAGRGALGRKKRARRSSPSIEPEEGAGGRTGEEQERGGDGPPAGVQRVISQGTTTQGSAGDGRDGAASVRAADPNAASEAARHASADPTHNTSSPDPAAAEPPEGLGLGVSSNSPSLSSSATDAAAKRRRKKNRNKNNKKAKMAGLVSPVEGVGE
ncbi:hypothetical protein F4810DRAFT_556566 [Camillea tinctor]|nr:hypothetical protein F4810DRAFT_556566 [Camillea tinctor]